MLHQQERELQINKVIVIELFLVVLAIGLGFSWILNPDGNHEPYLALIGFILTAIEIYRRKYSSSKSSSVKSKEKTKYNTTVPISNITLDEIIEDVNNVNPFEKGDNGKKYHGLKVAWTGYLDRIIPSPNDPDLFNICCLIRSEDVIGNCFWFAISVSEFPQIKIIKETTPITIIGIISKVSGEGLSVSLIATSIQFLESQSQPQEA